MLVIELTFQDRLPTYSASSTLGDAATGTANVIKTELSTLDAYLQGKSPEAVSDGYAGGISKGEVTEVIKLVTLLSCPSDESTDLRSTRRWQDHLLVSLLFDRATTSAGARR